MGREGVDPGAAGIAQAEQFGDLVEGLAGGVVYGVSNVAVAPAFTVAAGEVEVGVPAGDNQGKGWERERVEIRGRRRAELVRAGRRGCGLRDG